MLRVVSMLPPNHARVEHIERRMRRKLLRFGEEAIASIAKLCQHAALDDIGGIAYAADIVQMSHETIATRIFRS